MNKMIIFNLVYKVKKAKPEKSCPGDRLKMAYIKKRFIKYLPSCKYVNPLHRSHLKNKLLATNYATEQAISQLNWVRWCFRDGNKGKCKIAGYNVSGNSCSLSMDTPDDLTDVADEMSGVFVMFVSGPRLCNLFLYFELRNTLNTIYIMLYIKMSLIFKVTVIT